jgi:hypothetical protein
MLVPTAMLVLLPASTGTRFVPAYLRSGAGDNLGRYIPINIEPPVPLFFKPGLFMVNILKAVSLIGGLKLHDPLGILRAASGTGKDLQPQPPGLFTPVFGLLDVNGIGAVFAAGLHDVANGMFYIGGIPASHEGFRSGRHSEA